MVKMQSAKYVLAALVMSLVVAGCSQSSQQAETPVEKPKNELSQAALDVDTAILDDYGCLKCHSLDGSDDRGPTFKARFGKTIKVEEKGEEKEIVIDEQYLKDSIIEPEKQMVVGYKPIMGSYKDEVTEEDLNKMVEVLKQL